MKQQTEYAGFWIRAVAFVIDLALLSLISYLYGKLGLQPLPVIANLGLSLYFLLLTGLFGQTLGKRIVGIRVVRADGTVPSWGAALIRETIGKWLSILLLGIGFLMAGMDANKRALHDQLSRTYVVRTR
ncbi:RDD family protein [Paenibacillus filicis]|uniref:RDD family protein n=1 Tax=Paenibacillus filicis TaxID=669464 RepID=A0ABU9DEE1_9BACL